MADVKNKPKSSRINNKSQFSILQLIINGQAFIKTEPKRQPKEQMNNNINIYVQVPQYELSSYYTDDSVIPKIALFLPLALWL